jgi:hypothetical protein
MAGRVSVLGASIDIVLQEQTIDIAVMVAMKYFCVFTFIINESVKDIGSHTGTFNPLWPIIIIYKSE